MKLTVARRSALLSVAVAALAVSLTSTPAHAAPYASGVVVNGTTVTFVLNEAADALTVTMADGSTITSMDLDGSTKGTKTFTLPSANTPFGITASKFDTSGYMVPTGNMLAAAANGLSQPTATGGYDPISDESSSLVHFNSPRGVTVQNNPNAANFGTIYVANSAAGTTAGRTLGDGLYALKADQSDAFGYGDTAKGGTATSSWSTTSSAPWRITAAANGNVYVSGFGDTNNSNVYEMSHDLSSTVDVFAGNDGHAALPAGQNHGSVMGVYVTGSTGAGNLTVYTLDEDLTSAQLGGSGTDKPNLWKYSLGATPTSTPSSVTPTKINSSPVLSPVSADFDVSGSGKYYLAQFNPSSGADVVVLNADGTTFWDSLTASRTLLANPSAADILTHIQGIAVSPDAKYMALMLNDSDIAVVPLLADGTPDLANRLVIDTGTDITSGRDISFDVADNIYYVSSGQQILRVLSPGGIEETSYLYNNGVGAFYNVGYAIPEPASMALAGMAGAGLLVRRRRM